MHPEWAGAEDAFPPWVRRLVESEGFLLYLRAMARLRDFLISAALGLMVIGFFLSLLIPGR